MRNSTPQYAVIFTSVQTEMNKDSAEMADRNLKNHDKRLEAQNKDRSSWYKHYRVQTAQLKRAYEFERENKLMSKLYLTITTIRFNILSALDL